MRKTRSLLMLRVFSSTLKLIQRFQNHKNAPLDKTYYVPYGFSLISSLVDSWSVDWSKSLKVIYWQSRSCEVELEVCVNMFRAVIAYHWDPYMRDSQILNANLRNSLNFIDNILTTVLLALISSNAIYVEQGLVLWHECWNICLCVYKVVNS